MINDQSLYFVFNGRKSSDFNVWCSGDGLYRLPDRDVEYIAVPGRNGDLSIDNGRWQNVSVTYSCFIPKNFREHYADLVSWLASQKGYGRLEDARHPEFYWLARMDADVEPKMVVADDGGTFTLTFNCKPQRFLKSGEIPVEIPCEPAASPASARRYWRLSQFSSISQTEVSASFEAEGFSTAEVNAMQFGVIQIPQESLDWLASLGDYRGVLEFRGVNSDRFKAVLFSDDPLTATAQTEQTTNQAKTGWNANNFGGSFGNNYIIVQKAFGTEVYFNGRKIAQDETYQFGEIVNPTRFDAIPKFRITLPSNLDNLTGTTVYTVGVGQNGIALKWTAEMTYYTDSIITLDAEMMDAYILPEDNMHSGEFVSLNSAAKFYGNRITLAPGESTIRLDPMIAGCEIVPRWWTI